MVHASEGFNGAFDIAMCGLPALADGNDQRAGVTLAPIFGMERNVGQVFKIGHCAPLSENRGEHALARFDEKQGYFEG
jgi:hypothetical protein